jgi:hypothetical protein
MDQVNNSQIYAIFVVDVDGCFVNKQISTIHLQDRKDVDSVVDLVEYLQRTALVAAEGA